MKKMIFISLLTLTPFMSVLADKKHEKTAGEFIEKIFSGDVKSALKLSGVPFSFDRKDLIKDFDNLRRGFDKIVKQNGIQRFELLSVGKVKRTKGKHPDLKDDIFIYQVNFNLKKLHESLQIFIRRSDGKVVGLYG